jgi:hypothetical protein
MQSTKMTRADYRVAQGLRQLDQDQLDQISIQHYGVRSDGLRNILSIAHSLRSGGDLSLEQAQAFARNTFGDVPAQRINELVAASNNSNSGDSRARSFLQNLMKDRPDMSHRLKEVYDMAGAFSNGETSKVVSEYLDDKAAREAEIDRYEGKDKLRAWSEADPSKIGSVPHALSVRHDIESALDEAGAIKGFRNQSERWAPIADANIGTDAGDIFRNRGSEEAGDSNTIRSDLGETISAVYDATLSDDYRREEGLA